MSNKIFYRIALTTLLVTISLYLPYASVDAQNKPTASVIALAWNNSATRFASGDENGSVKIWDASTNQLLFTLTGHTGRVNTVRWNPDGTRLASVGKDKSVRIWNTTNGQSVDILKGHYAETISVAWSPNGSKLASSSIINEESALHIWNPTTGQHISSHIVSGSLDLAWSPDGSKLAGAIPFGMVLVLNTATFEFDDGFTLDLHSQGVRNIYTVAWSPDNLKIASGISDGTIVIWDVASKKPLFDLRGNDLPPIEVEIDISRVLSLAFSADGSKLVSVTGDGTVRTWNTKTGQRLSAAQLSGPLKAAALSQDGRKLVFATSDGIPQTMDLSSSMSSN